MATRVTITTQGGILPSQFGVSRDLKKTLKEIGEVYIKIMQTKRMSGRKADDTGLNARSGEIRKRKRFRITVNSGKDEHTLKVQIGRGLKYTEIQEEGGTIRAKNAKYLAIPLDDRLVRTAKGVQKYKSPTQYPGELFPVESDSGAIFLATETRGKKLRLLYILKKSVKIKARLGARDVVEGRKTDFRKRADRILSKFMDNLGKEIGK